MLTTRQANNLLSSITTEAELRKLLYQLDVSCAGSTTVLYSGALGEVETSDGNMNTIRSSDIVNGLKIILICVLLIITKASTFMKCKAFNNALFSIFVMNHLSYSRYTKYHHIGTRFP